MFQQKAFPDQLCPGRKTQRLGKDRFFFPLPRIRPDIPALPAAPVLLFKIFKGLGTVLCHPTGHHIAYMAPDRRIQLFQVIRLQPVVRVHKSHPVCRCILEAEVPCRPLPPVPFLPDQQYLLRKALFPLLQVFPCPVGRSVVHTDDFQVVHPYGLHRNRHHTPVNPAGCVIARNNHSNFLHDTLPS